MHALAEAIRFAQQFHNMGMVRQAVEQCGGQAFIAEDLYPICEFQVSGCPKISYSIFTFGSIV